MAKKCRRRNGEFRGIKTVKMAIRVEKWRKLAVPIAINTVRCKSATHRLLLHNGPDTVEELFERHLAKKDTNNVNEEEDVLLARRRLFTTRREALSLYRDILRASRFFVWPDSRGVLWRDVLRENARKEFEEARFERDPEVITRLLIAGRDAVQAAIDKLVEKQKQQMERERNDGDRGW